MELNKKDKTVFRQKIARDSDGRVICPMQKEVYVVQRWQAQLKQTNNSEKIAIFLHLYKKIRIFAPVISPCLGIMSFGWAVVLRKIEP